MAPVRMLLSQLSDSGYTFQAKSGGAFGAFVDVLGLVDLMAEDWGWVGRGVGCREVGVR